MSLFFEILRYMTLAYNTILKWWQWFPVVDEPSNKYFLSDDDEYDEFYTRVPEGAVYIEEWTNKKGEKLCYVQYEGEELEGHANPFTLALKKARRPWVWIGDENTEIDLTRTFNKFLIPNNVIELALVEKLIRITENTKLIYVDAKTLEIKKFPGDGILIEEDEE